MFLLKQIKKGTTTVVPFLSTPSGIRTLDPLIKSQLLYQLSEECIPYFLFAGAKVVLLFYSCKQNGVFFAMKWDFLFKLV